LKYNLKCLLNIFVISHFTEKYLKNSFNFSQNINFAFTPQILPSFHICSFASLVNSLHILLQKISNKKIPRKIQIAPLIEIKAWMTIKLTHICINTANI